MTLKKSDCYNRRNNISIDSGNLFQTPLAKLHIIISISKYNNNLIGGGNLLYISDLSFKIIFPVAGFRHPCAGFLINRMNPRLENYS